MYDTYCHVGGLYHTLPLCPFLHPQHGLKPVIAIPFISTRCPLTVSCPSDPSPSSSHSLCPAITPFPPPDLPHPPAHCFPLSSSVLQTFNQPFSTHSLPDHQSCHEFHASSQNLHLKLTPPQYLNLPACLLLVLSTYTRTCLSAYPYLAACLLAYKPSI